MRLLLTLEPADGTPRDVAAEVEPGAGVDRLVAALADAVDLPPGVRATCRRTGAQLEGTGPVGDAGLLDGDRIALDPATEASTVIRATAAPGAAVDLVVVGGPLMGTRIGLAAGEHVVGRGPGADVTLADRALSRRHLHVAVEGGGVSVTDLGSSNGTFVQGVALAGARAVGDGDTVEVGRSLLAFQPAAVAAAGRREDPAGRGFNRPPRVAVPVPAGTPRRPGAARGAGGPAAVDRRGADPARPRRRDVRRHAQPRGADDRRADPAHGRLEPHRGPPPQRALAP